jgi:hypothetical protein
MSHTVKVETLAAALEMPLCREGATEAGAIEAAHYELKAINVFASKDTMRPHMTCTWVYASDGGRTYMATDGHTIVIRRSGTHREMLLDHIAELPDRTTIPNVPCEPPNWANVIRMPDTTVKNLERRGVNPVYFARVAEVEKAAGKRANARKVRDVLRRTAYAVWTIGGTDHDGWYWEIDTKEALWQGIIMPRRV